jgi:hypothetical protein
MSWMRVCRASVGIRVAMAALVVLGTRSPVQAEPVTPTNTSWTGASGSGGIGSWGVAGNWFTDVSTQEVPTSTLDAILPVGPTNQTINLGSGAQAKSLFPQADGYTIQNGDLTVADQLWLNETSGTTSLSLSSNGSNGTVSVSAPRVTIGADAASVRNNVTLRTLTGGTASLTATDNIVIGYDGNANTLMINYSGTSAPASNPTGSATITAPTIQISALATSGTAAQGWNWLGTYSSDAVVNASNVVIGVAGSQGVAANYGGTWNVVNTTLGDQSSSADNYLTVAGGGTYTNSGAFAVGQSGQVNVVYVGDTSLVSANNGTLTLTGTSDVVIGANVGANNNGVAVVAGSTFSASKNVVVGQFGSGNGFFVNGGSTVTSGGARLGVDAASSGNLVRVEGNSSWTMDGTVRVGDAGDQNLFYVLGGTVTLTEPGKNFYVGYNKSASDNMLVISGPTAKLEVKAAGADVVISANAAGSGASATGNILGLGNGGTVDATRVLIGDGGTLAGDAGTITGNVLVGGGGLIAPGNDIGPGYIGALSILGNLDLSQQGGGRIDIDLAGSSADQISVGGILDTTNATLHFDFTTPVAYGAYVIANYGSLVGTFATVEGLPAFWTLDYNYLGLQQIAVYAIPEIDPNSLGSALALVIGALGLFERRARLGLRRSSVA